MSSTLAISTSRAAPGGKVRDEQHPNRRRNRWRVRLAWPATDTAYSLPIMSKHSQSCAPSPRQSQSRQVCRSCTQLRTLNQGDDSHDVVTLDAAKAYGEQCWKAGYKHGAWGTDKKDADRYRWIADSNNYYEAINLISDGSLTEDALGKAIDAAMAQGVK